MFALHETTQRRACRVTFLLLGVLPTLLTCVGIAYCNRPWRENDWQRALSHRFHVRTSLDDIAHPQPGLTVLKSVRLGDLRTDRTLGTLGDLRFHRQGARLLLHADHLQIEAEQLPLLAAVISTWLTTQEWLPFDFHIDRLTIAHRSLPPVKLEHVVVTGDESDAHRYLFQAQQTGQPLQIALHSQSGSFRGSLRAQQAPLPAWLIGTLVPGIGGCGEAKFLGELTVENVNHHLQGTLRGRLEGVNLQQWIGTASPHQLRGSCEVQLERLTWSEAKIEIAEGRIASEGGAASYSLFQALAHPEMFLCQFGPGWQILTPNAQAELILFDQLAVGFKLTRAGLRFAGECPGGALAIARGAALLLGPPPKREHPVAHLVRLFHFPQQGWLPDTVGAHQMSSGLPLPADQDLTAASAAK